jgi:hypothetical protein
MNKLFALLFLLIGGVFHLIAAVFQFAFTALLAILVAPFAFVYFIYHLFFENKKDPE